MCNANELRVRILLRVQVALLGVVTPNIRGIACAWDDNSILVRAVIDGPISDDDHEMVEEVVTEIIASFPGMLVRGEAVRLDVPAKPDWSEIEAVVYRRKE